MKEQSRLGESFKFAHIAADLPSPGSGVASTAAATPYCRHIKYKRVTTLAVVTLA